VASSLLSSLAMRITKYVFAFALCVSPVISSQAMADDGPADDTGGKPGDTSGNQPSHADPATKTLPATASATAQANAFGQQGARMKAAHAAAKAAAQEEAKRAAGQTIAAAHRNAHATGHATSHGSQGLEHAAGASGGHAHPH
jgi:hypothetical protein